MDSKVAEVEMLQASSMSNGHNPIEVSEVAKEVAGDKIIKVIIKMNIHIRKRIKNTKEITTITIKDTIINNHKAIITNINRKIIIKEEEEAINTRTQKRVSIRKSIPKV